MFGERIPKEISLESIYFAPFLFTVLGGLVCAFAILRLLNATGWIRFFWHPGLAFLALWALATSVIGLTLLPP